LGNARSARDDGGGDVFVDIKAVHKVGFNGLVEGAKVDFDVVDNRGKQAAENMRVSEERANALAAKVGRAR